MSASWMFGTEVGRPEMIDQDDEGARMLFSAARIDEAHARISSLQRHLSELLAQLSTTTPARSRGPLWRAYLRFDGEIESVKSGLERTHDQLVDDTRAAFADSTTRAALTDSITRAALADDDPSAPGDAVTAVGAAGSGPAECPRCRDRVRIVG